MNFGPNESLSVTVEQIIKDISLVYGQKKSVLCYKKNDKKSFLEASLLKLNCDKAGALLGWQPTLKYDEMVDFVGSWYREYKECRSSAKKMTELQIDNYQALAMERNIAWATE